jgi:hypothetical protein
MRPLFVGLVMRPRKPAYGRRDAANRIASNLPWMVLMVSQGYP